MFVINISAIIAVAMQIRAARGTEMIVVRVVRDMGEPLQPASRQVGRLLTVSMLGKKCQIRNSINVPIVTNQSVLLTLKAFANSSPGLLQPWINNNAESVR